MSEESDNLRRQARGAHRDRRSADARPDLERAVAVLREEDDPVELANVLRDLGELERRIDGNAARRYYEEAVAILRSENQPLLLAHTIRHLGDVHREGGSRVLAEPCYHEALSIYRSHNERRPLDLANAIRSLAVLKSDAGERVEAAAMWREAHDLYLSLDILAGVEESASRLALLI